MTNVEYRISKLAEKLKGRTQRDGKPRPGYEQNVAAIRAELEQLNASLPVEGDDNV